MVCRMGGGEAREGGRVGWLSGVDLLLNYLRLTENAGVRVDGVGLSSHGGRKERGEWGGKG